MLAVDCTMPNPAFEDGVEVLGSESTMGSDDSDGETGLPCDGLTECFGECVNTQFHDFNCGECGWICEPEQACVDGICVFGVKRAFVTSQAHGGSLTGGLVGADAFCNDLAEAAGLEGYFLAWLSNRANWPAAAYLPGNAYVMPDGTLIADTLAQLLDGNLAAPLDLTEHGEPQFGVPPPACGDVFAPVWSNTSAFGEAALGPSCMGWTSGDGQGLGVDRHGLRGALQRCATDLLHRGLMARVCPGGALAWCA